MFDWSVPMNMPIDRIPAAMVRRRAHPVCQGRPLCQRDHERSGISDPMPLTSTTVAILWIATILLMLVAGWLYHRRIMRQVEQLSERAHRLHEAQSMAKLGDWYWDVRTGEVEWSDEVFEIFERDPATFTPQIDSIQALSPWP